MHRDHHLPILFKGPFEPLEQADGLVLKRVHLCRIRCCFLSRVVLCLRRRGVRLRLPLCRLVLWLVCCCADGRSGEPTLANRWWLTEGAPTKCYWGLGDGDAQQQWAHRRHPSECPMSKDALHDHPPPLFALLLSAVMFNHRLQDQTEKGTLNCNLINLIII